jgi:hypothetical protein
VTTGQTKDNEPVLIMRERGEGDKLPDSLTKHLGVGGAGAASAEVEGQE